MTHDGNNLLFSSPTRRQMLRTGAMAVGLLATRSLDTFAASDSATLHQNFHSRIRNAPKAASDRMGTSLESVGWLTM